MSIPKRMTVNCSKCGKSLSVTVFESVNSDYADDIAMQIMSGELFNVKCPHCNFVSHLEYDVLYHDMRHRAMVWVVNRQSPDYMENIAKIRATPKPPYKTLRIVRDMNALKEKVSCLESNRDDRIVELCKVICTYNLLSQRPDFNFKVAFYTAVSGKEKIYLFDNDGNDLCCDFPDETYEYLKELYYGSHYAAQFDDNYPIVDCDWAENILTPLLKAEANDLPEGEEMDEDADPVNNTPTNDKKVCPKCKTVLPSDSEFCQGCGTKLSVSSPAPTVSNDVTEESERQRIAEIQNERDLAILKRIAATKAANKKKKTIKIIAICIIAVIVAFFIVKGIVNNAHNSELRNFATETMSDDFTNVYADVVSVEPQYFVYTTGATFRRISEVVCKCKTVEGKTIWVVFSNWEYPGGSDRNEDAYETLTYSKNNPARVAGNVTTSGSIIEQLERVIGDVFVLRADSLQE